MSRQPGPLREPPRLETLFHEHASMHRADLSRSFWRILALVQKVKTRRPGLSVHVADLAGIRNLRKMGKAEFRVVTRLQAIDHDSSGEAYG